MRKIAQEAGATAFHDFFHRAAEIAFHMVEAEVFGERGGGGHHLRIGTEDLRGDGMFVVVEIKIVQSAGGIASEAFSARELGHDEAAAAEAADYTAKNSVCDASHGRENRGGSNGAIANCEFWRKHG